MQKMVIIHKLPSPGNTRVLILTLTFDKTYQHRMPNLARWVPKVGAPSMAHVPCSTRRRAPNFAESKRVVDSSGHPNSCNDTLTHSPPFISFVQSYPPLVCACVCVRARARVRVRVCAYVIVFPLSQMTINHGCREAPHAPTYAYLPIYIYRWRRVAQAAFSRQNLIFRNGLHSRNHLQGYIYIYIYIYICIYAYIFLSLAAPILHLYDASQPTTKAGRQANRQTNRQICR